MQQFPLTRAQPRLDHHFGRYPLPAAEAEEDYPVPSGGSTLPEMVTTIAGLAGIGGYQDGTGSEARFHTPWGIAIDQTGNVYVADSKNNAIRKLTQKAELTETVYFPQFATGETITSTLVFTNPSLAKVASVKVSLFKADGQPLDIGLNGTSTRATVLDR